MLKKLTARWVSGWINHVIPLIFEFLPSLRDLPRPPGVKNGFPNNNPRYSEWIRINTKLSMGTWTKIKIHRMISQQVTLKWRHFVLTCDVKRSRCCHVQMWRRISVTLIREFYVILTSLFLVPSRTQCQKIDVEMTCTC